MNPVVEVEGLTKQFNGGITALSDVSFRVGPSEIFGLLGPNGSGKTTMLRILAGILKPSSGEAKVLGFPIPHKACEVQKRLGYLSQRVTLYQLLSAEQNFRFYSCLYGLSGKKKIRDVQQELFSKYGLTRYKDTPVRNLSGGFKQRLGLACALAHEPKVLLLDEPTMGIDPITRRELWDHFYELSRGQGITLLVTTHYMEEAERCDKVALLGDGRLFLQGPPRRIVREKSLRPVVAIELSEPFKLLEVLEAQKEFFDVYEFGKTVKVIGDDCRETARRVREIARDHEIAIKSVERVTPNIEDVFVQLAGPRSQRRKPKC